MSVNVTPNNLLIGKGGTAQFNVTANSIGALRYQWKKRGINVLPEKVLGEDTPALKIPNLDKSDGGEYYCIVTNMWNRTMESDTVILTVYGMIPTLPSQLMPHVKAFGK